MSKDMGIYCKAYLLRDLRVFPGWREHAVVGADGATRVFGDEDIVYVQDDLVVTDGIFKGENVLFDAIDEGWRSFCANQLGFAIPEDVLRASQAQAA